MMSCDNHVVRSVNGKVHEAESQVGDEEIATPLVACRKLFNASLQSN